MEREKKLEAKRQERAYLNSLTGPKEYQPAHSFWQRVCFFICSGGHKL